MVVRIRIRRSSLLDSSSRTTLLLSLLACTAGVLWQLQAICVDYFAYAVVSEVSLVKVYNIQPPALSLCLPYVEVLDTSLLRRLLRQSPQATQSDWRLRAYHQIQENVPVSQLFSATPDLSRFLTSAWVRRNNSYSVHTAADSVSVRKFLRDDLVCYRVADPALERDPAFYHKSHHVTFGKRSGGLMGLRLNKSRLRNVTRAVLFLHPIDNFPRGDRDYALFLSTDAESPAVFDESHTFWTISWSRTLQVALEPPFTTACRNNQVLGFENKEHCQHECVQQRTLAALGKGIFTTSITDSRDNFTVLSSESLLRNRSLELLVDRLIGECNDSCWGHNCHRVNYLPLLTSALRDDQSVVFQVFDQNALETRVTFQEKLPFVAFLVYLLSVVGFWFGVSCLDLLHSSARLLAEPRRLRSRCRCRERDMKRRASRPAFDPERDRLASSAAVASAAADSSRLAARRVTMRF